MFKLRVKPSIQKDVKSFPKQDLERIANDINALKIDPLPSGVKKIKKGKETHYRIRQGDFRIGYFFDPIKKVVEIIYIKRRDEDTYK